jgi:predicted lipoprotein with Yx(FWY)xxD motif
MRGVKLIIGLLLVWTGVVLAQEAAQQAAPQKEAGAVTVQAASSDTYGNFLTDGNDNSLYLFMNDTAATADAPAKSACTDTCLTNWQPLLVTGKATAGPGINADLLGTLTRADGTTQVTYNGHPLYYFAKDANSGDTAGHGVGDVWFLVSPEGDAINP